MKIVLLDERGAEKIYREQMTRDFPAGELKPFQTILTQMRSGIYEPLAFCEQDGTLAAYAWQTVPPDRDSALVDYFAVLPQRRGQGTGTRALAALVDCYKPRKKTLIIECEHPAEAPDAQAARRRIGFYLRAGAQSAAIESRVAGVRYMVLALPCRGALPEAAAADALRRLYACMSPQKYGRGNVIFYGN